MPGLQYFLKQPVGIMESRVKSVKSVVDYFIFGGGQSNGHKILCLHVAIVVTNWRYLGLILILCLHCSVSPNNGYVNSYSPMSIEGATQRISPHYRSDSTACIPLQAQYNILVHSSMQAQTAVGGVDVLRS